MTPAGAMRAIGYVRRSKESDEQTISLDVQTAAIRDYARRHGWELVEPVLEDDGVSGGRRERFTAISATLTTTKARRLVVYSQDRLGRDLAALLDFSRQWARRNVEIHAVDQGRIDAGTVAGYARFVGLGLGDELFRLQTGDKTRAALERLRRLGCLGSGQAPYGWRALNRVVQANGRKHRPLEPVPHEQRALDRIAELTDTGRSLRALSRQLEAEGYLARNGKAWQPRALSRIVTRVVTDRTVGHSQAAG